MSEQFNGGGLRRMAASRPDYYGSNGHYVTKLASVLLAEREAKAAAIREIERIRDEALDAVNDQTANTLDAFGASQRYRAILDCLSLLASGKADGE